MTAAEYLRKKIETLRPMFQHSGTVLGLLDALEALTPELKEGEFVTGSSLEEAATILGWNKEDSPTCPLDS